MAVVAEDDGVRQVGVLVSHGGGELERGADAAAGGLEGMRALVDLRDAAEREQGRGGEQRHQRPEGEEQLAGDPRRSGHRPLYIRRRPPWVRCSAASGRSGGVECPPVPRNDLGSWHLAAVDFGAMRTLLPLRLVLLSVSLAACASTDTSLRETAEPEVVSWEEGCQDSTTLELLCSEDTCAFFRCQDLAEVSEAPSGEVEPARWPGLRPPGGPRRGWRQPRRGAEPVFVIRWNNHPAPNLPNRRPLSLDLLVKHHIFPQAPELAAWFQRQGINIHQYTLLIPRGTHLRIHSGGPRGGMWNAEWRQFTRGRERVPPGEIWQHAIKLIIKYDLTGANMGPYR